MSYFSQGQSSGGQGEAQLLSNDGAAFKTGASITRATEAFDAGLAFAWNNRIRLLQGGFIAGLAEIALTYFQYFLRLSQQEVFLVLIAGVASTAWLMTYVGTCCLSVCRGESDSMFQLAVRAVQNMPKIVLSYVVLIAMAMALFAFPPLLIFAVFGIWAPAFCIAELFALPVKDADEPPDDAYDDDVVYRKVIRFRHFQGRPIWDLGFARSIGFVGQNFGLSLQFSLFAWTVVVVPAGVMLSLAGYYPSFSSIMLEVLAANLLEALLLGAGMACFVLLIPQEARAEIGLPTSEILTKDISRAEVPSLLQFRKRRYPLLVVVLLGLFSTQLTWQWIKHQHSMPSNVQVTLESAELTKDRLVVTVLLNDEQQLYRWLDPDSFRLQLLPVIGQAALPSSSPMASPIAPSAPASSGGGDGEKEEKDANMIEPERVMPFGVDGTPLDENNFTPYQRPLRLVMYFARPENATGKFQIFHGSFLGMGKPIAEGEFAPSGH